MIHAVGYVIREGNIRGAGRYMGKGNGPAWTDRANAVVWRQDRSSSVDPGETAAMYLRMHCGGGLTGRIVPLVRRRRVAADVLEKCAQAARQVALGLHGDEYWRAVARAVVAELPFGPRGWSEFWKERELRVAEMPPSLPSDLKGSALTKAALAARDRFMRATPSHVSIEFNDVSSEKTVAIFEAVASAVLAVAVDETDRGSYSNNLLRAMAERDAAKSEVASIRDVLNVPLGRSVVDGAKEVRAKLDGLLAVDDSNVKTIAALRGQIDDERAARLSEEKATERLVAKVKRARAHLDL